MNSQRLAEIDALYAKLNTISHYQILGIKSYATTQDIRKAYFSLSKLYHPDTQFQKVEGDYKAKMEAIFARMTQAYDVLSDEDKRFEYDRALRSTLRLQIEPQGATLASGDTAAKRVVDSESIAKRAAARIRRVGARVQTPVHHNDMEAQSKAESPDAGGAVRGLIQTLKNVKK